MKVELYDLLPAVYRNRDFQAGQPLRALVNVLEDEVDILRQDIDRLYDNWFIESCDEWVVSYIGDLLSASGLHPGREGIFSLRAFVANTLAYRRRKGTASVLENIAQDVSGWSAAVTEFFQLLTVTQHLSHVRSTTVWALGDDDIERIGSVGNADIRKERLMASVDTAFDTTSRTIDIRPFEQYYGWHNIDRLGIFIWRLRSYPMQDVPPRSIEDRPNAFYFHPLGLQIPLFASPKRQSGANERRREWEVPQAIDRDAFAADLERYYGEEKSLLIKVHGEPIQATAIIETSIPDDFVAPVPDPDSPIPKPWAYVDVERGRLVIEPDPGAQNQPRPPLTQEDVSVTYYYGFSGDIGGGPYGREVIVGSDEQEIIRVAKGSATPTLTDALRQAGLLSLTFNPGDGSAERQPGCTLIRIMDSGTYEEEDIRIYLVPGDELIIEASGDSRPTLILTSADWQPTMLTLVHHEGENCPPPPLCQLRLSGLLIEGQIWLEGDVEVEIEHCTIVPSTQVTPDDPDPENRAALHVPANSFSYRLAIDVRNSLIGPIQTDVNIERLTIQDSIVDGFMGSLESGDDAVFAIEGSEGNGTPGCTTSVERSTILGEVCVRAMPFASESLFSNRLVVEERQGGCMKYCYIDSLHDTLVTPEIVSRTPQRFRCQPDLALIGVEDQAERARIRQRVRPVFSSTRYGQPNYGRLSWRCPEEIRTGAENGSEMGVFSHLMEPQRESNLREAVRRYLPFGLEMNVIYADEETTS